jgi:hypothetical protein
MRLLRPVGIGFIQRLFIFGTLPEKYDNSATVRALETRDGSPPWSLLASSSTKTWWWCEKEKAASARIPERAGRQIAKLYPDAEQTNHQSIQGFRKFGGRRGEARDSLVGDIGFPYR